MARASRSNRAVKASFRTVFAGLGSPSPELRASDDFRWLQDNARLIYSDLQNTAESFKPLRKLPHVRIQDGEIIPRTLALAEAFLSAASYQFSEQAFRWFFESVQESTVLNLSELWAMVPVLKLVLLEQIALRSGRLFRDPGNRSHGVGVCLSDRDVFLVSAGTARPEGLDHDLGSQLRQRQRVEALLLGLQVRRR